LACNNIYLIVFTGFEVIEVVEFTSIDINSEFWSPCLEIFNEFPDVNINARFACCEVGFEVLSGND